MYNPKDNKGGPTAGGSSNPAFRADSGPSGNVGIGRPTGSGSTARPISDDFSSHPDEVDDNQKQKKRMYIIMGILGFLALAFLIIAIVMIVLYANEKDKTVYPQVTPDMLTVQPYYFSFVDYNRNFSAGQKPIPDNYATQIEKAAQGAYPKGGKYGVYTHVDSAALVQENVTSTNYWAVVSVTVVLVEIRQTKSTRRKRVADGFPTLADFTKAIGDNMGQSAITTTLGIAPDVGDSTAAVCKDFDIPPLVPPKPQLSTSTYTVGTTSSGPIITTPTKITTTTRPTTTTTNPCPSATTSCPACPSASLPPTQTPPATLTPTSCPPTPPPTVCSTVPPATCTPCPSYSTPPPTTPTGNPHTGLTIPPTTATTTVAPDGRCKFDLVFIVDESESVGQGADGSRNWQLIKNALKSTAESPLLTISPTDTRMAWVGFSSDSYTTADQIQLLKDTLSSSQTSAAVDRLSFHPGGSNAISAFNFTRDVLLTLMNGARKDPANFREVIILISDGDYKTWDQPIPASSVAIPLRTGYDNASIYAIAITETGQNIDDANLLDITGYEDHTYKIANYSLLAETIRTIIGAQTCIPPVKIRCQADLILVVDRSESVGDDNFAALKKFLVDDFTNLFHVDGDNQYRFAMVSFSDDVKVEFHLGELKTNEAIASHITNNVTYYHPGATNTYGALDRVLNDILNPAHYKPIACSGTVIVLFTDGIHDVGGDPQTPAEQLRTGATHATIVSVGIGPLVVDSELLNISGSADLVYHYDDFTHLGNEFVDFVNNITCKPDPILVPCNDPHDVAIVVDLHKELNDDDFASVIKYLKYLTSGFYLNDGQIQLSLVTYGSNVVNYTPLRNWTSNAEMSAHIDTLKRDSNSGDPTAALAGALKLLNTTIYNPTDDRDDFYYPDVIIIITTQPTDYSADLDYWAHELLLASEGYTEILGIAAGDTLPDHTTAKVLRYIAEANADNVVEFDSLLEFSREICLNNDFTQHIVKRSCEFYPAATPAPTQCYTVCSDTSPAPTTTYSPTSTPSRGTPPATRTTAATTVAQLLRMSGDGHRRL